MGHTISILFLLIVVIMSYYYFPFRLFLLNMFTKVLACVQATMDLFASKIVLNSVHTCTQKL